MMRRNPAAAAVATAIAARSSRMIAIRAERGAGNPFLPCPGVTPHLSSTCAHHVLVRVVRGVRSGETDVSRENQTRKIDRTTKEPVARPRSLYTPLSLRLPPCRSFRATFSAPPTAFHASRIAGVDIDAWSTSSLARAFPRGDQFLSRVPRSFIFL